MTLFKGHKTSIFQSDFASCSTTPHEDPPFRKAVTYLLHMLAFVLDNQFRLALAQAGCEEPLPGQLETWVFVFL